MKLMKKVLVLALVAATILMVACDNGNGGGGTSSSGADGNGGGTGTGAPTLPPNSGTDTFVPPTLPQNKGDDPFAGLKTLTTDSDTVRYQVDTTKKVLTEERSEDGTTWSKRAEYSYSYDGTATPPTVTGRIEAQYEEGKRFTLAEALAAYEPEFKADFTQGFGEMFDQLSSLDTAQKEATLAGLNEAYGLTLTVADLAADKKNATLEKVWNSTSVQDMLKEGRDTLKKMFSMTPTYAVTLTDKSGTTAKLAVEGQYDSTLPWHEQITGSFASASSDYTVNASFDPRSGSLQTSDGSYYKVTEITKDTITCSDQDGNPNSFSYTIAGTDKNPVVTITLEGDKIECTWRPSTRIGQYR